MDLASSFPAEVGCFAYGALRLWLTPYLVRTSLSEESKLVDTVALVRASMAFHRLALSVSFIRRSGGPPGADERQSHYGRSLAGARTNEYPGSFGLPDTFPGFELVRSVFSSWVLSFQQATAGNS